MFLAGDRRRFPKRANMKVRTWSFWSEVVLQKFGSDCLGPLAEQPGIRMVEMGDDSQEIFEVSRYLPGQIFLARMRVPDYIGFIICPFVTTLTIYPWESGRGPCARVEASPLWLRARTPRRPDRTPGPEKSVPPTTTPGSVAVLISQVPSLPVAETLECPHSPRPG